MEVTAFHDCQEAYLGQSNRRIFPRHAEHKVKEHHFPSKKCTMYILIEEFALKKLFRKWMPRHNFYQKLNKADFTGQFGITAEIWVYYCIQINNLKLVARQWFSVRTPCESSFSDNAISNPIKAI